MATTKKTTTAKTAEAPSTTNKLEEENKELKASLAEMQEQMKAVLAQLAKAQTTTITAAPLTSKKIKVVSLFPGELNLSTEEFGRGKNYSFKKFGEERLIRFDELEEIVHVCARSTEEGEYYICDSEAVVQLGLEEQYENMCSLKEIQKIIELDGEEAVDMFIKLHANEEGTNSLLQSTIAKKIAENLHTGKRYDLNAIDRIKRETGIDIQGIADSIIDKQ